LSLDDWKVTGQYLGLFIDIPSEARKPYRLESL
jgi:hypothetical protein